MTDPPAEVAQLMAEEIQVEARRIAQRWGVDAPYTSSTASATYVQALIQVAFQAGYDYRREHPEGDSR